MNDNIILRELEPFTEWITVFTGFLFLCRSCILFECLLWPRHWSNSFGQCALLWN